MDAFISFLQMERNALGDHVVLVHSDLVFDWLNAPKGRSKFGTTTETKDQWRHWMMDCRERRAVGDEEVLDMFTARIIAVPVNAGSTWAALIIRPERTEENGRVLVHLNSQVFDCTRGGSIVQPHELKRIKQGLRKMAEHLGHSGASCTVVNGTNHYGLESGQPAMQLDKEHPAVSGQVVAAHIWAACLRVQQQHVTVSNAMRLHRTFLTMLTHGSKYRQKVNAKRGSKAIQGDDSRAHKRRRTEEEKSVGFTVCEMLRAPDHPATISLRVSAVCQFTPARLIVIDRKRSQEIAR